MAQGVPRAPRGSLRSPAFPLFVVRAGHSVLGCLTGAIATYMCVFFVLFTGGVSSASPYTAASLYSLDLKF